MFAPTPEARVISVITVKTGARQSLRKICLTWFRNEFKVEPPAVRDESIWLPIMLRSATLTGSAQSRPMRCVL